MVHPRYVIHNVKQNENETYLKGKVRPNIYSLVVNFEKCIKYWPNSRITNSVTTQNQRIISSPLGIFLYESITSTEFMTFKRGNRIWIRRLSWIWWASRSNSLIFSFFLIQFDCLVWLLNLLQFSQLTFNLWWKRAWLSINVLLFLTFIFHTFSLYYIIARCLLLYSIWILHLIFSDKV